MAENAYYEYSFRRDGEYTVYRAMVILPAYPPVETLPADEIRRRVEEKGVREVRALANDPKMEIETVNIRRLGPDEVPQ